jgi:putative MATE family efflux protein
LTTLPLNQRLILFFSDREYYRRLVQIGLPIAAQQFLLNSLNMVGVILIGQLGEASVAAVGLANQVYFLLNLTLFGFNSGASMFTAQLWGKQDLPNIHRVTSLTLKLSLLVSLGFLVLTLLAPEAVLGIYSTDPEVIRLGSAYLRVFGWSFVFVGITYPFSSVVRSTGNVRIPLIVSTGALSLNMLLSYLLIFGHLGLPRLGMQGAAVGTLVARILESVVLVLLVYRYKLPAAVSLRQLLEFDAAFSWKVLKPVLPIAVNEILWSFGITSYSVAYARISTEAIAAMNIFGTLDGIAFTVFIGIGNACAILVGHWIGAGDQKQAFRYALRSLSLGVLLALVTGGVMRLVAPSILTLYKVSPGVIQATQKILNIMTALLFVRASNMILYIGAFRSGGDTRFGLIMDGLTIWVVGVPLAFAGAFLFHLPVQYVYLLAMSEEITKWAVALWRFFSRRWIHDLTQTVAQAS